MDANFGESLGIKSRLAVNKTIYFVVGVCFVGFLSSVYLFFKGFKNGWKKVGKIKV